jgi:hypothetical protein
LGEGSAEKLKTKTELEYAVSEPLNKETGQQRMIRLLQLLESHSDKYCNIGYDAPNNNIADLLTLHDLLKASYITAEVITNGSGIPVNFIHTRISPSGSQHLAELVRREHDQNTLPKQVEILNKQIVDLRLEITELKSKNQTDNLWDFFKAQDWKSKASFAAIVFTIFIIGYGCAKNHLISTLLDLFRDIKP